MTTTNVTPKKHWGYSWKPTEPKEPKILNIKTGIQRVEIFDTGAYNETTLEELIKIKEAWLEKTKDTDKPKLKVYISVEDKGYRDESDYHLILVAEYEYNLSEQEVKANVRQNEDRMNRYKYEQTQYELSLVDWLLTEKELALDKEQKEKEQYEALKKKFGGQ